MKQIQKSKTSSRQKKSTTSTKPSKKTADIPAWTVFCSPFQVEVTKTTCSQKRLDQAKKDGSVAAFESREQARQFKAIVKIMIKAIRNAKHIGVFRQNADTKNYDKVL